MGKVLAGGTFNVIHPGHILFLEKARELGDCLVVVVSSNETAAKTKKYPVKDQEERKMQLERIASVDKAVVGDPKDFFKIVLEERPDVIALGYDQKLDDDVAKKILDHGIKCKIVRIKDHLEGYSTSSLMKNKKRGLFER